MFKGLRRHLVLSIVFVVTAMIFAATVYVQNEVTPVDQLEPDITGDSDEPVNETPTLWFVEMSSPPTSEGTSVGTTRKEKADFRVQARRRGIQFEERMAFDKLWNGVSVKIEPTELAALARTPGVKAIYPVETYTMPDPIDGTGAPELATALAQTGANIAQSSLGFTGAGVKVGIIDSGIDIDNPSFGGSGVSGTTAFPTARVAVGWDFVGDAFTSPAATPMPDPNPDDCGGHGTHVAGIVGADGHITGVAPGVTFGAYRVFGCAGTTSGDIMIAAMERALDDGMDVVNMSIGVAFNWPQHPTATAADRLVNKGVVVVCSAGNEGPTGTFSSSAPGVGKKVIGVASFNNTHSNAPYFTISDDNRIKVYSPAVGGTAAIPSSGSFELARTGTQTSTEDACAPLPAGSLTGKVALIRRGGTAPCGFYSKSINAQNAGALAVVIYNNVAGPPPGITPNIAPPAGSPEGSPLVGIPVVGITQADGNIIDTRLAVGSVTITWTDQFVGTPILATAAGLISSFSSYGLSPDLTLKPDIGAPGGTIRSTVPINQGSIAFNSGTSMASPHVAGAAALLLEARPHTSSQAVRSILQNSADPKLWSGNPALGFIDIVHRQGAGMLDIDDAILATTKVEPGKLSLGESELGPSTNSLNIKNEGSVDVTYNLSQLTAIQSIGTFPPLSFFNAPSTVVFSQLGVPVSSMTIPAGGAAVVDVTISPHAGLPDRSQYGGYLVLTPQGGGQIYRVPFAGLKGDYQSIQVLVPTVNNLPRMARLNASGMLTLLPVGDGGTWTLTNAQNTPFVAVHLDHHSRRLLIEVFDAVSGKSWHHALELEYLPRNQTATQFFGLPWDGITTNGNKENVVPNGQYVLRLTVEKALSDGSPGHTETWTSPVITLARP